MNSWDTYPQPGEESFRQMYSDRNELLTAVKGVIKNALPTDARGEYTVIRFSEIESSDAILGAINESPRPALTMFLAVTGLSTEDIKEKTDVSGIYGIADTGDYLPHKDSRAQQLAPLLVKHLPIDLLQETVLQQTAHRWTLDHRRHHRKEFEDEVLDRLSEAGVPLRSDSKVPGQPDIAVPINNDKMAVVGEIRRTNKQDRGNRTGEFNSEVRSHSDKHPESELVVVIEIAEQMTQEKRQSILDEMNDSVGDILSGIYTPDNIDQLVVDCQQWTNNLQPPLHQFTSGGV